MPNAVLTHPILWIQKATMGQSRNESYDQRVGRNLQYHLVPSFSTSHRTTLQSTYYKDHQKSEAEGECCGGGAGCGKALQSGKTHALFGPCAHPLELGSLLNGMILGIGRCGQVTHGGGATMLGAQCRRPPPRVHCKSGTVLTDDVNDVIVSYFQIRRPGTI